MTSRRMRSNGRSIAASASSAVGECHDKPGLVFDQQQAARRHD
jgi:hypothetical protein